MENNKKATVTHSHISALNPEKGSLHEEYIVGVFWYESEVGAVADLKSQKG